jgi:hypothetical protein
LILLWSLVAAAQTIQELIPRERPDTPEGLIADLQDGRSPDQLYAVRELRRLARISLSDVKHRDPIRSMEARQFLVVFDDKLAPICIENLPDTKLTRPCADILGLLETESALPALNAVLPDTRRGTRRHVERAIHAIEES